MLMQGRSDNGSPDEPGLGMCRDWPSADAPGRVLEPPVADATEVKVVTR